MFRVVPPPIIRSAYNCIYSIYPTRCNVTQSIYIWKLLYMFRVVPPPIIRSAYNCIYSIYPTRCNVTQSISGNCSTCFGWYLHPSSGANTTVSTAYIQQDATSHSLFISGNCSTCFGWYLLQSSGAHTTVSTESCICHTVTAICR